MRRAQVGDIVVVMEPCYAKCTVCPRFIGATALVATTYKGHDEVQLEFAGRRLRSDPVRRSGFFARNLYNTGLTA